MTLIHYNDIFNKEDLKEYCPKCKKELNKDDFPEYPGGCGDILECKGCHYVTSILYD